MAGTVRGLLVALLVATPITAQSPEPFEIAGRRVAPGTRLDFNVDVPAGASDPATYIPVTVLHGRTRGPVVAITAGVHGYEYPPILAAQALREQIDPTVLSGTVVLVRIAHVEAFEQRVPFVNPFDRKNLNRAFPGSASGTQTERIAWALTTEVVRRSDLVIELHSGDGAEWLEGFVGVYDGPLASGYARARAAGLAYRFPHMIRYVMETQQQVDAARSLNRQAVADGKPTILVELGENGRRDTAFVNAITSGTMNALRTLGVVPGAPAPPRADTRWFDGTASATSRVTGIFTPDATSGRFVRAGERIGTVRDYAGALLQEITSPVDGYVMYGLAGPSVRAGEGVATIALPATESAGPPSLR